MAVVRGGVILLVVFATLIDTLLASDYFWHLTDLHQDQKYPEEAISPSSSCNVELSASERGMFGSFQCDAPWELIRSVVEDGIMEKGSEPKFILWTGDSMPHSKDRTWINEESVLAHIQKLTTLMEESFGDIPVIPILGNHDIHPKNQFTAGSTNEYYVKIADMWDSWLDASMRETFEKGAYYSRAIPGLSGFRILALNTNLFYVGDQADTGDDPGGMLAWAQEQLDDSRSNNEKVYLVFHVTPGISAITGVLEEFEKPYNKRFNKLIVDNADVIQGMFGGHEHYDGFKLWYDEESMEPKAFMLVAPSVTPWTTGGSGGIYDLAHNPGIRQVFFDSSTYQVEDFDQYYLDLKEANEAQEAEWQVEYSFNDAYGTDGITSSQLADLLEGWETDEDSESFADYYKYRTVSVEDSSVPEECDCTCRFRHICSIKHVSKLGNDMCLAKAFTEACATDGASMMVVSTILMLITAALQKIIIA